MLFLGLSLLLDLLNNARLPGSIRDAKGRITHLKFKHPSNPIFGLENCPAAKFSLRAGLFYSSCSRRYRELPC